MKDDHLMTALRRALARYGSQELPPDAGDDAAHRTRRPARSGAPRARTPGWVSIGEIEASQPPNSYPRLGRREIKRRCRELAAEPDSPVARVRSLGLRTWVRVAGPDRGDGGPTAQDPAGTDAAGTDATEAESAASDSAATHAEATDAAASAEPKVQGPRRGRDGGGPSDPRNRS